MTASRYKYIYLLFICLILAGKIQIDRVLRNSDVAWVEPPAEQRRKYNPQLFRAMVFGQIPVAIDWLLLKCLVDTTLSHVQPGKHNPYYYDLELITDLDPRSQDLYFMGGNLLTVAHRDVAGARDLLK